MALASRNDIKTSVTKADFLSIQTIHLAFRLFDSYYDGDLEDSTKHSLLYLLNKLYYDKNE